uniref:Syntaxin-121 n=1 Tax=Anthurium amnicola TaxID=1678845 RepID=A0A1D1XEQ4_9ARAE
MNNLFSSGSFSQLNKSGSNREGGGVQMAGAAGANLDKFFEDVEGIKEELKEVERLHRALRESNEAGRSLHDAGAVRSLRARMDADVALALKKAKLIKLRLEALDRANAANRSLPGCGPGSSTDRTRTSLVAGLRKKLKDSVESFSALRDQVASEYRETVGRRYYTVTGEAADESTLDTLISTGEAEMMVQRAIQEQAGRGEVVAVLAEIKERHGAALELERSLAELQQVFMDMSVLVAAQGEQLDDIESQVKRADSFVRSGAQQLHVARSHQKNSRKWACFGILLLLVIVLVIVLPIVIPKNNK